MAELHLESFLLIVNPVLCPGDQIVSGSLIMRPYPTMFKSSGGRIKVVDNDGEFMQWSRENGSDTGMRIELQSP